TPTAACWGSSRRRTSRPGPARRRRRPRSSRRYRRPVERRLACERPGRTASAGPCQLGRAGEAAAGFGDDLYAARLRPLFPGFLREADLGADVEAFPVLAEHAV